MQDYYLLLFLHFADFPIGKFVADLDISAFHAGGTGFDDSRALKFAQRIDDNGTGNARLIRDFTCDQNAFRPMQLLKDQADRFQFRIG